MSATVLSFEHCDVAGNTGQFSTSGEERTDHYLAWVTGSRDHAQKALYEYRPALKIGQPHAVNRDLRVARFVPWTRPGFKSVKVGGNSVPAYLYRVAVEYVSDSVDDPTAFEAETDWIDTLTNIPAYRDNDGNALVARNGQPLAGITRPEPFFTIEIEKNVVDIPVYLLDYGGAVNETDVTIDGIPFAPRTLAVAGRNIGRKVRGGILIHRPLRMTLIHNPRTWDEFRPNQGTWELALERTGIKRQAILTESDGEPVDEPQWLDAQGRRPRIYPDGSAAQFPDLSRARFGTGAPLPAIVRRYIERKDEEILKDPLEPDDLIVLRFRIREEKDFNIIPGVGTP